MADARFLNNRPLYHTASRIAAQTGYSLAQALDVDGHIVKHSDIWTAPVSAFPMNTSATTDPKDATNDLVAVFKDGTQTVNRTVNNGSVYRNDKYPAVELYEQVEMTGVLNSDGKESGGKYQAYEIKEDAKRVMDWIAPTAIIDPIKGTPVAGFSGIAEACDADGNWVILQSVAMWSLSASSWEFAPISGMLRFEPTVAPEYKGYTKVRFTGFRYIGNKLDAELLTMSADPDWIEGDEDVTE